MKKNSMNRFIGKYCKIITKEPGEEKTRVITGIVRDIDYDDGFITIESKEGVGCLNIRTIEAIKPRVGKI